MFRPNEGVTRLCAIKVTRDWPMATCKVAFAGNQDNALLDLGSYVSFIAARWARRASSHLTLGPIYDFGGIRRAQKRHVVFADRYKIGNDTWEQAPVAISTRADRNNESLIGWTMLAPLGRILLDFPGRTIYQGKTEPHHGFFDTLLKTYGIRIDANDLIVNGADHIPLGSIKSLFGLPIHGRQALTALQLHVPATARGSLIRYFLDLPEAFVLYAKGSQLVKCPIRPGWAAAPPPQTPRNARE